MRRRLGAPVQLPTRWQRRRLPRRSSELRRQLIRLRHASTHHTVMESLEHELVPPHLSHGTQAHRRPDRELQPLVALHEYAHIDTSLGGISHCEDAPAARLPIGLACVRNDGLQRGRAASTSERGEGGGGGEMAAVA